MRKFIWKTQFNKPTSIKEIMKDIIQQKHLDAAKISNYVNCDVQVHDGYLLNNMYEAIDSLKNAKCIGIIGDFDSDGITATTIMYLGLKSLTSVFNWDIHYAIPERKDGYGLSKKMIDRITEYNADYIVTVDNGIAAAEAVDYAHEKGINVIITDHHQPGQILPNCLIVDPQIDNYPFKYICGALVAFKFIETMYKQLNLTMNEDLYNELISLAAIGTIADVMKLVDENRFYVGKGLIELNKTKNFGLKALIEESKLGTITAETIAFQIGPMINAAGRLASAQLAMDLLLADDEVTAKQYAKRLINLNQERRKLQKEATEGIPKDILNDNFIVLYKPDVSHGICGTIASSISDKYKKPCFVLSGHNKLTGSGRSAKGYSILKFIQSIPDLAQGGGHSAAAGISILEKDLDELRKRANEHFSQWLIANDKDLEEYLYILCEIDFDLINMRLANNLEALAPFGVGNPRPVFMTQGVDIISASFIGNEKNVLKMELKKDGKKFQAIVFADVANQYTDDMENIDIAFQITLNEFPKDNYTIQLQITDLRKNMDYEDLKSQSQIAEAV